MKTINAGEAANVGDTLIDAEIASAQPKTDVVPAQGGFMAIIEKAPQRFIDLTGIIYGRLTVVSYAGQTHLGRSQWLCQCDCGKQKVIRLRELNSGSTHSCGCLAHELASLRLKKKQTNFRHGLCKIPEYRVWAAMLRRCKSKKSPGYKYYGGRGISVCSRWHKFANFLDDMGRRPSNNLTIERINNDGNYEPSNCKWATRSEQTLNSRRWK